MFFKEKFGWLPKPRNIEDITQKSAKFNENTDEFNVDKHDDERVDDENDKVSNNFVSDLRVQTRSGRTIRQPARFREDYGTIVCKEKEV